MTRVLVHTDNADEALSILAERHTDITFLTCNTYEDLPRSVAEFAPEVIYTCRFSPAPFPREAMVEAPSVKWVSNAGSGVNHLTPWDAKRVAVTNSAGVAADAMAEFALASMLYFATGRPQLSNDQANRRWGARQTKPLSGATLLCIGLGPTGRRMAALGKALGMTVCGIRASGCETMNVDHVFRPSKIEEAMASSDYILVCLPLTTSSRGLVGETAFAALKPGAILVDLSRGGIVDPSALMSALDDGRLSGAALDVFATEPLPKDNPLWERSDVLISPHCSGVYDGWEAKSVQMFADNIDRWLSGEPLQNIVDPTKGY